MKQLLLDLDQQRAHLQAIIDALPVGLWVVDATGNMVFINGIAQKIWGGLVSYSKSIEDYHLYKAWWPATGEVIAAENMPLANALRGETILQIEIDFERFDGTRGTQLVSSVPIKISDGTIVGAVELVQDITERKRSEQMLLGNESHRRVIKALETERLRFFKMLETLPIMVCLLTPDYMSLLPTKTSKKSSASLMEDAAMIIVLDAQSRVSSANHIKYLKPDNHIIGKSTFRMEV